MRERERASNSCRMLDVTSLNSFTMASAVEMPADQLTASHPRARSSLVALSSHLVKNDVWIYIHLLLYIQYIHICTHSTNFSLFFATDVV